MSIIATVENDSIKLPVHVPDGTVVEINLSPAEATREEPPGSYFDSMRELIGSVEGPEDWAAEHDHYTHGTLSRLVLPLC